MADILDSSSLNSTMHQLKNVNDAQQAFPSPMAPKPTGGDNKPETVQANKGIQCSNKPSEFQVARPRGRPPIKHPSESNRFTIDNPNSSKKIVRPKSAKNNDSVDKQLLSEQHGGDQPEVSSDVSTDLQRQTRARYSNKNVTCNSLRLIIFLIPIDSLQVNYFFCESREQNNPIGRQTDATKSFEDNAYLQEKTGTLFESVSTRKNAKVLADRIASFRRKQEKKREKITKILAKRAAKKAAGLINDGSDEVIDSCIGKYNIFDLSVLPHMGGGLDPSRHSVCSFFVPNF